jgi:hypothetical protein
MTQILSFEEAPSRIPPSRATRAWQPASPPPAAGAPAAHASQAWAAQGLASAEACLTAANAAVIDPAARVARALCVLVREAEERPAEMSSALRLFTTTLLASPAGRAVRADIAEGQIAGRFSQRALEPAVLAVLGVAAVAMARTMDEGGPAASQRLAGELAFGLLRSLGVADEEAASLAADAAEEILGRPTN